MPRTRVVICQIQRAAPEMSVALRLETPLRKPKSNGSLLIDLKFYSGTATWYPLACSHIGILVSLAPACFSLSIPGNPKNLDYPNRAPTSMNPDPVWWGARRYSQPRESTKYFVLALKSYAQGTQNSPAYTTFHVACNMPHLPHCRRWCHTSTPQLRRTTLRQKRASSNFSLLSTLGVVILRRHSPTE